ncbi:MAG: GNAT family N-acetyltransferase [Cyanobacteria bacterium J06597_1]
MVISSQYISGQATQSIASALETISIELGSRDVSLLPVDLEQDKEFLFNVYSSTREAELSVVGWSGDRKSEFLHMQFDAQQVYYQTRHSQAELLCVYENRRPIGRLYLEQRAQDFCLLDIALLKHCRGRGIGTALVTSILKLAHRERRAVYLHVERYNPAIRLFRRLGFRQCREVGVSYLMEWAGPT